MQATHALSGSVIIGGSTALLDAIAMAVQKISNVQNNTAEGYRAQNYHADKEGVTMNFATLNAALGAFRESAAMPEDWNAEINKDYEKRHKKR